MICSRFKKDNKIRIKAMKKGIKVLAVEVKNRTLRAIKYNRQHGRKIIAKILTLNMRWRKHKVRCSTEPPLSLSLTRLLTHRFNLNSTLVNMCTYRERHICAHKVKCKLLSKITKWNVGTFSGQQFDAEKKYIPLVFLTTNKNILGVYV